MPGTNEADPESGLFREVWKNSPDIMFVLRVTDDDFYLVSTNHSYGQSLPEETTGQPLKSVIPTDAYNNMLPHCLRCAREGVHVQYDSPDYSHRDNTTVRHRNTLLTPVADKSGATEYIFGVSRDVTEQKKNTLKAKQAAKEAEQANKIKTVFLATMSHEMRTPLNGIRSAADLLSQTHDRQEQADLCQVIRNASDALHRLTNDILEYARIDAGKLRLENRNFLLMDLIEEVRQMLKPLIRNEDPEIIYDIDPAIPLILNGDADRIRQILINLMNNAVKFTRTGHIAVRVKLINHDQNLDRLNIRFEVEDTGTGITTADMDRLFQPFSQIHDHTAGKPEGTGLGLAICKDLVEKMGGRISARSTPGTGSVFTFNIICSTGTQTQTGTADEMESSSLQGLEILLAEDNITNQIVTEKILQKAGCSVTIANNGREALRYCNVMRFDLILMDWHMPIMDGLEATRRIRSELEGYRDIPIIGLTANAMEEAKSTCLKAGMDEVITKPIDRMHLLDCIAYLAKADACHYAL